MLGIANRLKEFATIGKGFFVSTYNQVIASKGHFSDFSVSHLLHKLAKLDLALIASPWIKELEDTFISINRKNGKEPIINYQNPSIQDFLVNYVNEDEALKEDLIKSTTYLDLTLRLFSNNSTINGRHHLTMSSQISQSLERKIYSDFDNLEYKGYSWQNIKSKDDITVMKLSSIKAHMKSNHGESLDSFVIDKLKGIIYSKKISSSVQSYIELIYKYHKQLDIDLEPILRHLVGVIEDYDELMEFANLRKINEDVYDSFFKDNTEDCDKMIDGVIELLYSNATDNYTETIEQLENIESEFGHSVDDKVLEFRAKMEEIEFNSDIDYDAWKDQKAEREYGISEDKMINELFDSYE